VGVSCAKFGYTDDLKRSVLKSEHSDFSMSVRDTQDGFSAELVMLSPFKTSLA
jgi:hypothetical protein